MISFHCIERLPISPRIPKPILHFPRLITFTLAETWAQDKRADAQVLDQSVEPP